MIDENEFADAVRSLAENIRLDSRVGVYDLATPTAILVLASAVDRLAAAVERRDA